MLLYILRIFESGINVRTMTTMTRRRCGREEGLMIQTVFKVTRNIIFRNTHSIKVLLFIVVISFAKVSAVGRMSLDEFIQRDKYDEKNDRNLLENFPIEHPENINGEYEVSDVPKSPTRNRLFSGDGRKSNKGTVTRQPILGKGTKTKQPKSGKGIVRSRTKQPSSGKGGISGKGRKRGTDPAIPISNDQGEIPRSQLFEP